MKKGNKKLLIYLFIISLPLGVGVWAAISGIRLYINLSNSLPHTLFVGKKSNGLVCKKGIYVFFNHPKFPGRTLIKQIKAIEGDSVTVQKGQINVGSAVLPLLTQTRKGEKLAPLPVKDIAPNTVFVAGTHPRSFDSRYEEFGLVHQSQIKGQAWPLF